MATESPRPSPAYPSGWYALLMAKELPSERALRVERFGQFWAVWRDSAGVVQLISDRCPHRGASLSQGKRIGDCLACPFHGFRFDGEGRCIAIPAHGDGGKIPARMRTRSLVTREVHDYIWAWFGSDPPAGEPGFFSEVAEGFSYSTVVCDWEATLSRCIENQLDYTHLPFVHASTIGRSFPKELDVQTTTTGNRIRASVSLPSLEHFVELVFPNVWINPVGGGGYVQIAFVPLSEFRTRLYVRSYQRRVRLPLLRSLANGLLGLGNRLIINQDRAVVERQLPQHSPDLDGSEVLVPSDGPIIAYRKMREARAAPGS
jgi:phenylpropionate dioxygenase-like ring-hydroxylating dioxygenase large terminal subunit